MSLRPYHIGISIAACGPFVFGFMTVEPQFFITFAIIYCFGHMLLRPYDLPCGMEWLQNTGFILLLARAALCTVQTGLILMAAMALANMTGFPFRAFVVPGRPELSQSGVDPSTGTLLIATVAISLIGIALARLTRTKQDLFASRRGIWGIGEAFDRFMTRRFSRRTARFHPQASLAGDTASMVVIRPWALRPFPEHNSIEAQTRLVSRTRPGGHQIRLAYVLTDATSHGNQDADTALRALLALPNMADVSDHPAIPNFHENRAHNDTSTSR